MFMQKRTEGDDNQEIVSTGSKVGVGKGKRILGFAQTVLDDQSVSTVPIGRKSKKKRRGQKKKKETDGDGESESEDEEEEEVEVFSELYNDKLFKFSITKHVEQNRDLYFVKLVAGGLGKQFFELIEVTKQNKQYDSVGNNLIRSNYKYSDTLLTAWARAIETVKSMIYPQLLNTPEWGNSETLHKNCIEDDTFIVALADFVAYLMAKRSKGLIVRGQTRFELAETSSTEDELLIALMRPLHFKFSVLRDDLRKEYF